MICLVTGAAGFIGSHLSERLIADGHRVIGVDNLTTGSLKNLASIENHKNFVFYRRDVSLTGVHGYSYKEVDWMFHLAAKADVVPSIEHPFDYHRANVTGTVKVLESARILGTKRFIYAASSSCYGIPDLYPTPETAPIRPMYPYALTKWMGEEYVMHWAHVYGLHALSLRLFNVYGPRSRTSGAYGAVFGVFLSQLANNLPLTVVGDGSQSRDFTHVSDVVEAFVKAAESGETQKKINIGTGLPQSVNYLASCLQAKDVVHIEDRPGEPKKTQSSTELSEKLLNWTPKVAFVNGADQMLRLKDNYKDAPLWTKESIAVATKSWFEYLGAK